MAALAGTMRSVTRLWGEIVGMTIDGVVSAAVPRRRRRTPQGAPGEPGAGARQCVDLIDLRTGEQIDRAPAGGLAAAAPSRRARAME